MDNSQRIQIEAPTNGQAKFARVGSGALKVKNGSEIFIVNVNRHGLGGGEDGDGGGAIRDNELEVNAGGKMRLTTRPRHSCGTTPWAESKSILGLVRNPALEKSQNPTWDQCMGGSTFWKRMIELHLHRQIVLVANKSF